MSLTHWLIVGVVVLLFMGPSRLPALTRALGESFRNLKKGAKGEGDIDVTDSVKRLDDDK